MSKILEIEKTLRDRNFSAAETAQFLKLYQQFQSDQDKVLNWSKISTPSEDSILNYEALENIRSAKIQTLLSELTVCRLNGDSGETMGCIGPKSAIEVKNGKSFLDLIVDQLQTTNKKYRSDVPLVLMNSLNTDEDTQKIIKKYNGILPIHTFRQNQFPRLRKDSHDPLSEETVGNQSIYPPGHGDFYQSIYQSGLLNQLINQGRKYMFIANIDNLGASVDLKILNLMHKTKTPFIIEVTEKTRADIKGGTLVKTDQHELRLLEITQVPKEHEEDFQSVKKFKIFNTNNIWINLIELKKKIENGGLHLDVIANHKKVEHIPVIQLETALGAGINNFEGSLAVKVPRTRFVPIKKTDDLLLIQSNLFVFEDTILKKNPERQFDGLPLIRLGENCQTIEEYKKRFQTIPDILELDLLTVVGSVYFGKNMTLRGNVIIVSDNGSLHLPDFTLLENKVITGNIKMGEL